MSPDNTCVQFNVSTSANTAAIRKSVLEDVHTHSGKKHWCAPPTAHPTVACTSTQPTYTLHSYAEFPRAAIRTTPTGLASPWIPARAYLHCTTLSFLTPLACVGAGYGALMSRCTAIIQKPTLSWWTSLCWTKSFHIWRVGDGRVGCVCGGLAMCKGAAQPLTEANSFLGELLRQKW